MLIPLEDEDYVAFGIACCFVMNDDLKLDGTWHEANSMVVRLTLMVQRACDCCLRSAHTTPCCPLT